MAQETTLTLIGNLVDNPDLHFTAGGHAVVNFRVATTPRVYDKESRQWKDGDSSFMPVACWRQLAENVAESLRKGDRVIVYGTIHQDHYQAKDGERRSMWKLLAEEVAASLKFAQVKPAKMVRASSNGGPSTEDLWAGDGPGELPPPF